MFKREESRHDFAFMAGVVIGAVAGAAATLALAPRAGTETRERLRARMDEFQLEDYRNRATQTLRGAADSPLVETAKARVTEIVERSPLPVSLGSEEQAGEASGSEQAHEFAAEVEPGEAERVFGAVDADAGEEASGEGAGQAGRPSGPPI